MASNDAWAVLATGGTVWQWVQYERRVATDRGSTTGPRNPAEGMFNALGWLDCSLDRHWYELPKVRGRCDVTPYSRAGAFTAAPKHMKSGVCQLGVLQYLSSPTSQPWCRLHAQ